jgi:hypothetical protein
MPLYRIFRGHTDFDMMHLELMRELIKKGREVLARPVPDTFAGRKTQEPFPKEDDSHIAQWVASKKLEPQK